MECNALEFPSLFVHIDINGDGTMEWVEFTSFCVEAGFVATRRAEAPVTHVYVHNVDYTDHTSGGDYVRHMNYDKINDQVYVVSNEPE